ncbi:hypothetical protein [Pseudorhodoplanes sp.]
MRTHREVVNAYLGA